jgi:hypothetical protein
MENYQIFYDTDIIEEVKKVSDDIDSIVCKHQNPKENTSDDDNTPKIRIQEYGSFNIIYFETDSETYEVPRGITCRRKNSEEIVQVHTMDEYEECFIINPDYDYDIYLDNELLFSVYCERSFEITNEITGEKSKLVF